VLPIVQNGSGIDTLTANKTSSWGGTALRDPATGLYHMWYSEIQRRFWHQLFTSFFNTLPLNFYISRMRAMIALALNGVFEHVLTHAWPLYSSEG